MVWQRVLAVSTGYGLDGLGFEPPWSQDIFSSPYPSRPALGPHPDYTVLPLQKITGTCPDIKWPGRCVEHPASSRAVFELE